ncbi:MAG: GNAT family N-acetyltransferase [Pseudomonadota bacterium]
MEPVPTARLRLRQWREEDRVPFRAINADEEIMAFFPSTLSDAQSDALMDRIRQHHAQHGFGLWALELRETSTFIGFTGLAIPSWAPPFGPCVEIGWRLAREHWGRGYATEAARATLDFGFGALRLAEIVSFTAAINQRSEQLMQRLGMHHAASDDFDHPALPSGDRLARHVLYRLSGAQWDGSTGPGK